MKEKNGRKQKNNGTAVCLSINMCNVLTFIRQLTADLVGMSVNENAGGAVISPTLLRRRLC